MAKMKHSSVDIEQPLSVEERETKLRIELAEKTPFCIKVLDESHFPYTNYEVTSETKACYTIEIRSLDDKINSCSCPNYKVNNLGTCKHIQGVLHYLEKNSNGGLNVSSKAGSPRVEIFLNAISFEAHVR